MLKKIILLLFSTLLMLITQSSCRRNSIPCPGNGTMSAKDLSLFDEEGNLKSEKKKKKGKDDNGLVNKKKDDRLKARRKESLDDKPKHMKR